MKILTKEICANSEMIKNYKNCREKAETLGKIFILKNNRPDAVLLSIAEYKRLSVFIEYVESLNKNEISRLTESLPIEGDRRTYSIDNLKNNKKDSKVTDMAM